VRKLVESINTGLKLLYKSRMNLALENYFSTIRKYSNL